MTGNWVIDKHHIAIDVMGEFIFPSSSGIYKFLEYDDDAEICGVICQPLQKAFPDIRFSKMGMIPFGRLSATDNGCVQFDLFVRKGNKQYEVDIIDGRLVDHCVCDKTWHYISSDATALVQSFISNVGIVSNGVIPFKQYIKAVEQIALLNVDFITNDVQNDLLKSPINQDENIPSGLLAQLYPYQETGYYWLKYMLSEAGGCILGDEMGLGKTMQVIATMLYLKSTGCPHIVVVAPISLLANWRRECNKFAPTLNVIIHHGPDRISNYKKLLDYDVIITSYTTIVSDVYMFNMVQWDLVVLDEAQNIKNPRSQRANACKLINRKSGIAVSGTPFENHVTDIWSIVDFIFPGLLGSLNEFNSSISDDVIGAEELEPILTPLMLRRLVKDVAKDLPEKVVSTQPIRMSEYEASLYNQYRESILKEYDLKSISLAILQKLRIFCSHPFAIKEAEGFINDPCDVSIKYQRFCEIVQEIVDRNEKVIVFTSYLKMFEIFAYDVPNRFGIKLLSINGETPVEERQSIVDKFNSIEGSAILILNPRAAGTGLNITGANHVIHYNLEWNPSLEDQATARAYRRGQQKTVFVYRLYYEDTIEEVVNDRILRKRDISAVAIIGNDGTAQDRDDLIAALQKSPTIK